MLTSLVGWHTAILLLMVGVPVVLAVILYRRARRARATGDPAPVVSLTLTIAAFYGALCLIGAVIGLVVNLAGDTVLMTVPTSSYWPLPLPGVTIDTGSTSVVGGGFTEAELSIAGAPPAARVLWAIGQFIGLLVPTAIAGLIALVCFQLLRGSAFAPVVARASMITAVVVLLGGLGTQLLCGWAGSIASDAALRWQSADIVGYPEGVTPDLLLPSPAFNLTIDFWPIGAALAFAALAAVFRYGFSLQRETEGLV
ncbi:hypothetical protein [Microbacterium sp.]|uniref:hypothetical protein n=1 Tax=Microbacterium sp. TaxID=51671 RepID=UPI003F6EC936